MSNLDKLRARKGASIYASIGVDDLSTISSSKNLAAHLAKVGQNPSELDNFGNKSAIFPFLGRSRV